MYMKPGYPSMTSLRFNDKVHLIYQLITLLIQMLKNLSVHMSFSGWAQWFVGRGVHLS